MSSSSDSSSSEINQSQGFYHDGRNDLPEMPALPEPFAPSQVPLAPDDTLWRKYSSHYEFPLSMLLALGIHIFAVLCILAYMTIGFYFKPTELAVGTAIMDPSLTDKPIEGDNPLSGGKRAGDEAQPSVGNEDPHFDLGITNPSPPNELSQERRILPDPNEFSTEAKKSPLGKSGNSRYDGKGNGDGEGDQPGVGKQGQHDGPKRWTINMRYDTPEAFIEKLADLRIVVAVRQRDGRFLIFDSLAAQGPSAYRELTLERVSAEVKKMQRSFYVSTSRTSCENFALGMNLSEMPLALYLFIPRDLEEALLQTELKHYHKTVDEIKQQKLVTTFDVKRTATGWDVKVIKSETDPKLKY